MDYVQNKNVSMINEHKLGIFGTKNLEITKKIECITDAKYYSRQHV